MLAKRRVVRYLPVEKEWGDAKYFYGAPTFQQAKLIAWDDLKALVPDDWKEDESETDLIIKTKFGSSLHVIGLDKPQRFEGVQWDGGVLDESSDQKPKVFSKTFIPALAHKKGWCWRIGVPKRFGVGAYEFKEFFEKGLVDKTGLQESYTWPSWTVLSDEQISEVKEQIADIDYEEQFGGLWQSPEGQIYYGFDKYRNTDLGCVYDPSKKLLIGSDFNVSPMSWVICQRHGDTLHVIDEIYLFNTNTPKTLDELHRRYGQHKAGFRFVGDATGRARKTSASLSDYKLIKSDTRFENKEVSYPSSNPYVSDRFATVNAQLSNARVLIHPKCEKLIDDLETRAYKENTSEPDNSNKLSGHITDALGYLICRDFPLKIFITNSTAPVKVM